MKKNEQRMLDRINEQISEPFKAVNYTYSRYDAENSKAVIELKYRNDQKYDDGTLIEYDKYCALMREVRNPFYAVAVEGNIYIFNLRKLTKDEYDYRWEDRYCNQRTEFKSVGKVSKKIGLIDWNEATKVIPI